MNQFIVVIFVSFLALFPNTDLAAATYPAGSLLALKGLKDAAVYYIGDNGKKYIFPDAKTYFTWYQDFSAVQKVTVDVLDQYPDGGLVPYKAGVKLITHPDTARIYAVEPGGLIRWLPSEQAAIALYGPNWLSLVSDVLPLYFSLSYVRGEDLTDKLPTGTVIKSSSDNSYYYVNEGKKKKFSGEQQLVNQGFQKRNVLNINDLSKYDDDGVIEDTNDFPKVEYQQRINNQK